VAFLFAAIAKNNINSRQTLFNTLPYICGFKEEKLL